MAVPWIAQALGPALGLGLQLSAVQAQLVPSTLKSVVAVLAVLDARILEEGAQH